jgi:membrane-bound serine protease (ClpP class)
MVDYVERGIQQANRKQAECLVIRLNTPGGLLKSTRLMVSSILNSPIPVVVYVSPSGAQAASAGVFITLAGHLAAMSPGTNIGAAHPVAAGKLMDSVMNEKVTNDAVAFIRSIAQDRNRDSVWAERTVRESLSFTAQEAFRHHVIDIIAADLPDLMRQIEGKEIRLLTGTKLMHTGSASLEEENLNGIEKILQLLADPNIAYILMLLGIYGLLFELYSPGAILPGILGGISIILAFYGMHTLPVNYAGVALILFGIILYLLEIKVVSYGLLGIGGTVAILLGSMMLIRHESTYDIFRISRGIIIAAVLTSAAFFFLVIATGVKAQRRRPVTGGEALLGAKAIALDTFDGEGQVQVMGEIWRARSAGGTIQKGQQLSITGRINMTLLVEPV